MYRKIVDGEVEMVMKIHVDDILAANERTEAIEK